MRRLYLLRHAKSSWELAGQLDYERGLTERGWNDCELIAELMLEHGIEPDFIYCSGARRARDTLKAVAHALPNDAKVEFEDAIYRASTKDLLDVLRGVPKKRRSVLLVGHNPSIHDLAVAIARESVGLERVAAKFPTAALAEFEYDGNWSELAADTVDLANFTTPKQLRVGERETL
ncbi:MAG: histidine phosphatase family protein [Thermoleophilaceae bacterium]|nr:histidine phosphatase family protein [Thermoleophilaceae bacterium]